MTNPTSNFGWQMPTSTDLVTDLPADFEVFGQAVDTDFVDLLGGTTGQVLSKTSNADLDFTWVAANPGDITGVTAGTGISGGGTSGTVTVTNDMATTITAAGDIVVGTGSGTYDNLPIGTTAQVLTADTTVSPYKVKWATPATPSSGLTLLRRASFSAVATTTTSFDTIFTATYTSYIIIIETLNASATTTLRIQWRLAGSTQATADWRGNYYGYPQNNTLIAVNNQSTTSQPLSDINAGSFISGNLNCYRVGSTNQVTFCGGNIFNNYNHVQLVAGGNYGANGATDGFILSPGSGTITGTVSVYGLAIA